MPRKLTTIANDANTLKKDVYRLKRREMSACERHLPPSLPVSSSEIFKLTNFHVKRQLLRTVLTSKRSRQIVGYVKSGLRK